MFERAPADGASGLSERLGHWTFIRLSFREQRLRSSRDSARRGVVAHRAFALEPRKGERPCQLDSCRLVIWSIRQGAIEETPGLGLGECASSRDARFQSK